MCAHICLHPPFVNVCISSLTFATSMSCCFTWSMYVCIVCISLVATRLQQNINSPNIEPPSSVSKSFAFCLHILYSTTEFVIAKHVVLVTLLACYQSVVNCSRKHCEQHFFLFDTLTGSSSAAAKLKPLSRYLFGTCSFGRRHRRHNGCHSDGSWCWQSWIMVDCMVTLRCSKQYAILYSAAPFG